MNLNTLYDKLPAKIRDSERVLHYSIEISKFIRKFQSSKSESNSVVNFLFKSTNVKASGTLRHIQLFYIELLRFIDNVCKKYNLQYCLIYGTLLGAVRHGGFIPWDDDCDILMMRKDYNKLIEVLPKEINNHEELKENCGLQLMINSEDNFFKNVNDIYDDHYNDFFNYKALFLQIAWLKPFAKVDIFPFDYIEENSINFYNKYYLSTKFYFRRLYGNEDFSFKEEFDERFNKLGLTLNETDFIAEGIDCTLFDDFGAFKQDWIFPLKTIDVEGNEFKCPNKPEKLLELWYGNYMDIPLDIVEHSFVNYNETLFESQKEIDSSFKEAIDTLKKINEKY